MCFASKPLYTAYDTRAKTQYIFFFLWAQFSNPSNELCVIVIVIVIFGLGWAERHPRPEARIMLLGWAGLLIAIVIVGLGWAARHPRSEA